MYIGTIYLTKKELFSLYPVVLYYAGQCSRPILAYKFYISQRCELQYYFIRDFSSNGSKKNTYNIKIILV